MKQVGRTTAALGAATLALLATAPEAAADREWPTQKFPFTSVGGAPLRDGWLMDIHTEGPRHYAFERYHLAGAEPRTTYQAVFSLWAERGCEERNLLAPELELATVSTNGAGNGNATFTWSVATVEAAGLAAGEYSMLYDLRRGDVTVYTTGCVPLTLD